MNDRRYFALSRKRERKGPAAQERGGKVRAAAVDHIREFMPVSETAALTRSVLTDGPPSPASGRGFPNVVT